MGRGKKGGKGENAGAGVSEVGGGTQDIRTAPLYEAQNTHVE